MVEKVLPMDSRLAAAVADGSLNVSRWCRAQGCSRQTFYKWRRRYAEFGLAGLEERSRAPRGSPYRVSAALEDLIVLKHKDLCDAGLDCGASSIHAHLERAGVEGLVSVTTIWRVLVRRGLIVPEPNKRPKAASGRFEWSRPNECWQIDDTSWWLADGTEVRIIDLIDDHSRVNPYSLAVAAATCATAWQALVAGARFWGFPSRILSDNGLAYSGERRGIEVSFEANARAVGIKSICSSVRHPQTCGKVERFHQTLKRRLTALARAETLDELQAQLDEFREIYNNDRPHQSLGRRTPAEVWAAQVPAGPSPIAVPAPIRSRVLSTTTNRAGQADITIEGVQRRIALGVRWATTNVQLVNTATHVAVFHDDQLIRALTIDLTRRFQPLHDRPGRPTPTVPQPRSVSDVLK